MIDHFSLQVRVGEKEPIPLTPILGGVGTRGWHCEWTIRPIASDETEEGRHTNNRVEIDLLAEMRSRMILREPQQIGRTSLCRILISASSHSCC